MSAPPSRTNVRKLFLIHMAPTDVLVELATHLKVTDTRVEVILECFHFNGKTPCMFFSPKIVL